MAHYIVDLPHMHELVVNKTLTLVENVRFISILCNEVMTYDQQS
jgi:hypothetical protein